MDKDGLFKLLESFKALRHLPIEILRLIVTYTVLPPIQGHFLGRVGHTDRFYGILVSLAISKATGDIFLVDCAYTCLQVFRRADADYIFSAILGSTGTGPREYRDPRCIDVDQVTDHILVADFSNHRVQELKCDGTFIRFIGNGEGSKPGQLSAPWGLAVDNETRLLYVSEHYNHRISVFSLENGHFVHCFGTRGDGDDQFEQPSGLHFDHYRKLLLIADRGNHRVKVVRPDGSLVHMLGVGIPESIGNMVSNPRITPLDVTVDARGEVFVTDWTNHRIQVFCIYTGQHLRSLGSKGSRDGQLYFPSGIWWDPETGRLFVSSRNKRVSIFQ